MQLGGIQCVKGSKRLIEQIDFMLRQEGAKERGALPHATGERIRIRMLKPFEAELFDECAGASAGQPPWHPLQFQPEDDIGEDITPGQQQVLLLHIADAAEAVCGRAFVQVDGTTGGLRETGNDIEQGAFAAAARPDDTDEFPCCGVQVYPMQDSQTLPMLDEVLADVLHAHFGCARYRACSAAAPLHHGTPRHPFAGITQSRFPGSSRIIGTSQPGVSSFPCMCVRCPGQL